MKLKFVLLLFTLGLFLFSCQKEKVFPTVFQDQITAFNNGDIDQLVDNSLVQK